MSDTSTTPTTDLPPRYDAAGVQAQVAQVWENERLFHAEPEPTKEPFCVVIPPPNVTAALHLGHAFNNTIQDILVRRARMQGKNAVWIPGTDHAGIATQTVVEKRLQQSEGKRRTDYEREEFVAKVQAWKDEYEDKILDQLKRMGCSCDFERTAFTMDPPRAKAVREAFFRLFKDGLIYRGKRLVNWDPATQTALADDEVENEEIDGHFYYLKYPLSGRSRGVPPLPDAADGASEHGQRPEASATPEFVIVATTRPETMLGDTAVALNPKDPRAAALKGMKVLLPIVDREIPIVEDDYVVMPGDEDDPKAKFATGFLKVTPAHDPNDWDIGQRHGLEVINIMAGDASISDRDGWTPETEEAKQFVGLSREAARERIVAWFKENDLLEKVVPYRHSVGHSYRSHVPVEPYLSDQWYIAVQKPIPWMEEAGAVEGTDVPANSLAGLALTALGSGRSGGVSPLPEAADGSSEHGQRPEASATADNHAAALGDDVLTFVPDRYAKTYHQWNAALRDWCISRQLWWGHRIPVWEVEARNPGPALDLFGICQSGFRLEWTDCCAGRHIAAGSETTAGVLTLVEQTIEGEDEDGFAARYAEIYGVSIERGDLFKRRLLWSVARLNQDPDVLDTWFSSALWPMSTLGWPDRTPELLHWNPTSVLCTAREIITLWVSRMVMFNRYLLMHPEEAEGTEARRHGGTEGSEAEGDSGSDPSCLRASVPPCLPFHTVFIHAMIQDGFGQKMSKSLGNGVDPNDVIDSHGADAMRFAVAGMATHTQDVRLPVDLVDPHTGETFTPQTFSNKAGYTVMKPVQTHKGRKSVSPYGMATGEAVPSDEQPLARSTSSKFDQGRNFCNKLWNAGRFVISNLKDHHGDTGGTEAGGKVELGLTDRWILARLSRAIKEANDALGEYRFDRYTTACYDFFWRDFCDWYVESTKQRKEDAAAKATLGACLDASLRLMHPAIPFATERLWWALNEAAPTRGIVGVIDCPASERCINAPWPQTSFFDEEAEEAVAALQGIVLAIRQVRADHKVPPREVVPVHVGSMLGTEARAAVELWATCKIQPKSALEDAAETTADGTAILVGGVVDEGADADRLAKEKADLEKSIKALKGRLNNKGYTDKAPPHLVQQTRDQLATAEAELAKL